MKKEDLKDLMHKMNVPETWYFLDDYGIDDQKLCINQENDIWLVYYSERGSKLVVSEFKNESDACEEFIKRIKRMLDNERKRRMDNRLKTSNNKD